MVVCDACGFSAPAPTDSSDREDEGTVGTTSEDIPLTWATSVERGQRRLYCERCSREHLRSIESKLDSQWW